MSLGAILAGVNLLGSLLHKKKRPTYQQTYNTNQTTNTTQQLVRNNPYLMGLANNMLPDYNNIQREIINSIQGRIANQIPKTGNVLTETAAAQMNNLLSNPYQSTINTQTYGNLKNALQQQYDLARQDAEKRVLDTMSKLGVTRSSATIGQMADIENRMLAQEQGQLANVDLQMMRDLENANLTQRQIREREIGQGASLGYQGLQAWNDLYYRAMNDAMNLYNLQTNAIMNAYGQNTAVTTTTQGTTTGNNGQVMYQPSKSGWQAFIDATAPIAGQWLAGQIYQQPSYTDNWWNNMSNWFSGWF